MTEPARQRLQYLPIEHAEPGMTLGEPLIVSEAGVVRFRLPLAHVLTVADIERLQRLNTDYVCVRTPDLRSMEEIREQRTTAEARVRRIFAAADLEQPHIAALFERVLEYRSA